MTFSHRLIIGAPGSGKSTLLKNLSHVLGYTAFDSGEMLRQTMTEQQKKDLETGALAPEGIVRDLVVRFLDVRSKNVIWTGFPRHVEVSDDFPISQPTFFDDQLCKRGVGLARVYYLNCPRDVIRQRTEQRGRVEDTGEAFHRRQDIFERNLPGMLNYYKGRIVELNATRTPEEVLDQALYLTT